MLNLIEQEQVTTAFAVPTIWQTVLQEAAASGSKLGALKRILTGGSACPPSIMDEFREKYGIDAIHAWGMTETSHFANTKRYQRKR